MALQTLAGWGRYPRAECRVTQPRPGAAAAALGPGPRIARGMGRAYGDSALAPGVVIDMRRTNRMLAFDAAAGVLTAEAGVVLGDVIQAFLPRGWFPPVTPGTKFVTLGGMIAADVHGKNHHSEGAFGGFVEWLDLLTADGAVRRCSRAENPDLFAHTIGGMGLTGVILRAAFRLKPVETAWIRQETIPCPNLGAAIEAFEAGGGWTYSVAWIDCLAAGDALGRSLLMLGEHAAVADLPAGARPYATPPRRAKSVPMDAPGWALNKLTVTAFNKLYYSRGAAKAGPSLVDWDGYFYPLDAVLGWNRIYGRKGFAQFQCVLPLDSSRAGLTALLEATSAAGQGSFLAVLKRMGADSSVFSFPMEGYTLALDFPISAKVLRLLDRLDAITLDHGGRFYLAKDARMTAATLARSDPRAAHFAAARRDMGAGGQFHSLQSLRLGL